MTQEAKLKELHCEKTIGGSAIHQELPWIWAAMVAEKQAESYTQPWGWEDSAVFFTEGGGVKGVIVYRVCAWSRDLWVLLSYVSPNFRQQAVYTAMLNKLRAVRDENHVGYSISSGVMVGNEVMHAVKASQRFKAVGTIYREDAPLTQTAPWKNEPSPLGETWVNPQRKS